MRTCIFFYFFLLAVSCSNEKRFWVLYSPDKSIRLEISNLYENGTSTGLYYTVLIKHGNTYTKEIGKSPLGIQRNDYYFASNLTLKSELIQENIALTGFGSTKNPAQRTYNELLLNFLNENNNAITIHFRVQNNGIAFRYEFGETNSLIYKVRKELTGFNLMSDTIYARRYFSNHNDKDPDQVYNWAPDDDHDIIFPVVVRSKNNWMYITETGLDGKSVASHLKFEKEEGCHVLQMPFPSEANGLFDNTSYSALPWILPWRSISIGKSLERLLENNIEDDLSPHQPNDVWAKTSYAMRYEGTTNVDFNSFVDKAFESNCNMIVIPVAFCLKEPVNAKQMMYYAHSKNIETWVAYNLRSCQFKEYSNSMRLLTESKTRGNELDRIKDSGYTGIIVNFIMSDKQDIIKQYLDILRDCEKRKLMVSFGSANLPHSWFNNYSYLLSSNRIIFKDEDYGNMRNNPNRQFINSCIFHITLPITVNSENMKRYSWPLHFAWDIISGSGFMKMYSVKSTAGVLPDFIIDYLEKIPKKWDETRFLLAEPNKKMVIARRNNNIWFLGGANGEGKDVNFSIPLKSTCNLINRIYFISYQNQTDVLQYNEIELTSNILNIRLLADEEFVAWYRVNEPVKK